MFACLYAPPRGLAFRSADGAPRAKCVTNQLVRLAPRVFPAHRDPWRQPRGARHHRPDRPAGIVEHVRRRQGAGRDPAPVGCRPGPVSPYRGRIYPDRGAVSGAGTERAHGDRAGSGNGHPGLAAARGPESAGAGTGTGTGDRHTGASRHRGAGRRTGHPRLCPAGPRYAVGGSGLSATWRTCHRPSCSNGWVWVG